MKLLLSTVFLCALFACSVVGVDPKPLNMNKTFVQATQDFSFDFLQRMESKEEDSYMVSPMSLHVALGMLLNGTESISKSELTEVLKLSDLNESEINNQYQEFIKGLPGVDPKVKNMMANSIWQRKGFDVESSFTNSLKEYFEAEHFIEDFGDQNTVRKINNWAKDNTEGKIDEILESISAESVMFLINALYFKGNWSQEFDPKATYSTTFKGNKKNSTVEMMGQTEEFNYAESENFKIVSLPYESGNYSMHIVLPHENISIGQVLNNLSQESWEILLGSMQKQKVRVGLPKFNLEYEITLNSTLTEMGVPSIFTNQADLSRISPPAGKLKVGFVKQNTFIEVDEKGTEAAAVTTIGIELTSVPSYPEVICDRPFFFMITENTSGVIQFAGSIKNM